jgi:hypothetical protein
MPTYSPFLVPEKICLRVSPKVSVIYDESSFTQVSASKKKRYAIKASFLDSDCKEEDVVDNLFQIVSQEGMTSTTVALKLRNFKENSCVFVPISHFLQIASQKDWQLLDYVFIFNVKDHCYYLVPQVWVVANASLKLELEHPVVPTFLRVGDILKDVHTNEIMWVEALRPGGVLLRYPIKSTYMPYSNDLWQYTEKLDVESLPLPFTTVMYSESYIAHNSLFLKGSDGVFFEEDSPWFNALKPLPAIFDEFVSNRLTCFTLRLTPILAPEAIESLIDRLTKELSTTQRDALKKLVNSQVKFINLWVTLTYRPESSPSDWLISCASYACSPEERWVFENPLVFSKVFKILGKGFRLDTVA